MANRINDKQVKSLLRKGVPGRFAAGNGLYFRVSKEKTGFWILRYTVNNKRREISLGKYGTKPGELSLVEAAALTAKLKADVKKGIDPQAEKKRPSSVKIKTVNELAADWLENDIEKRLKFPDIPRRIYRRELAPCFGELALKRVTPMDIRAAIEKITLSDRPSIANDALGYCKQLFRHGIRLNLISSNPAEAFTVHNAGGIEKSRHRALSIKELKVVFPILRDHSDQFTRDNYLAFSLLLILGVRKGELIAAKWAEIDFDKALWHLPQERSKTGVAITVPLSDFAVSLLEELKIRACDSKYVFPSRRASKRRGYISDDTMNHALAKLFGQKVRPGDPPANILGDAGINHFTIHDLRRTCRTLLADAGVPGHVAERCLNHKLKGVEGIYDRYDYLDERRDALQKITDQLAPIIVPTANVISFRKRA
ncbi:tyrosine-type recombinase/integrase [Sansalvadorimonas verongulae]|uniref:tyrosine-type recombinase/integrase n=1 Tax=Sansalvadorimonas verongulae TaxID=2172824 RepID=UPI0012BC0519|nr:site-specific integrase [Sansalvadorimonas verongulae]MTI13698.1 site-specific integrase [Sansalvadorimonas verongulae]